MPSQQSMMCQLTACVHLMPLLLAKHLNVRLLVSGLLFGPNLDLQYLTSLIDVFGLSTQLTDTNSPARVMLIACSVLVSNPKHIRSIWARDTAWITGRFDAGTGGQRMAHGTV
jgi:hypothetical protein